MFVDSDLAHDVLGVERIFQQANGSQLKIRSKDLADGGGLVLIDNQFSVFRPVAERRHTPHPHAFLLGCRDLVTDTFAGDLTLELGKGQQYVEGQPSVSGPGTTSC